ncbi:hypothetical protein UFOVP552_14 [uncultured Caudovirales phage]|uniref:Concanavalin A-like lectin/glucanases superfamily n=1 Tax=uncultured Caudovirales phage TaxID=2100421 RepID=A0A6J5MUW0_9CAUD|nr:hypothetical protein UFOVP552_14 [uncultured Caudovirales phage]
MKDNKYVDLKGLELLNTPRQLDQFEAVGSKAFAVRSIFDFSLTPRFVVEGRDTGELFLFENLVLEGDTWDGYKGAPGHASLMLENKPVWANNYSVSENYFITQTVSDITNELNVPYWNENALIYLDQGVPSIYNQAHNNPNNVREFRSGHIELTFKTNKQNSIIGVGTTKKTNYGTVFSTNGTGNSEAEFAGSRVFNDSVAVIDKDSAYLQDGFTNSHTLYLNLKNGKINIEYFDDYGLNKKEFSILGNISVSDDQWHHVVVNFGKPGIVRHGENKFNERFIEIWVDGKLDKRTKEYVNNSQIYFPTIDWLLMDPTLIDNSVDLFTIGRLYTDPSPLGGGVTDYTNNISSDLVNRKFDNAKSTAFKGSINHYSSGINSPLSKNEIQERYNLYRGKYNVAQSIDVKAEMVSPTIYANKKKALKLFWNKLVNENSKNGLELDDNFNVYTYSVTNKIINSSSEVYNVDKSISKEIKFLPDVKVVLKDNVLILGPGKELLFNRREIWNAQIPESIQLTPNLGLYDALDAVGLDFKPETNSRFSAYGIENLLFSGISLNNGDRILLTNQINKKENGIYIFNGLNKPLTRDPELRSSSKLNNSVVRVIDGYYKDTSWMLSNTITTLNDAQEWLELEFHPSADDINSQPIFAQRWSNTNGEERFIDLEQDINIADYDIIVFMNYPETNEEIKESFVGYDDFEIKVKYDNFIKSLQNVCAQGASLYVSSPKLAEDLGIVKKFTKINQEIEISDAQSAALNPFEINEPADTYFDTHRNNKYELATPVTGLTNKQTYILTDFINYNPDNNYDYEQYHAKYAYRQFGLQEGNEFIIPGLSLRKITTNQNLPGFVQNQRTTDTLAVVAPSDILTGTVVTKLANTYYTGSTVVNNPYDDYASTIIVYNNQVLGGQPITGKIFVNCVEDGYTFSRQEYNKAVIQVIPTPDANETTATRAWQYSTSRLNRLPQRINVRELTGLGQTTSTSGGGGPFIQAQSNASNGIIRSKTDLGNINYQSDLYASEAEEIYPIQEIPVLSMTWLGLQWLAE